MPGLFSHYPVASDQPTVLVLLSFDNHINYSYASLALSRMFIVCLNSGKVVKLSWSLSFSAPCFYTKRRNALALPEVMMTNGWLAHRAYCTTLHTLELACMTQQTDYDISDKIISTVFIRPLHTMWFQLCCYFNCRLCF